MGGSPRAHFARDRGDAAQGSGDPRLRRRRYVPLSDTLTGTQNGNPAHSGSFRTRLEIPDWSQPNWSFAMTDPGATSLSLLSSAVASVVARATPAIVSVHSHRSRASGF